MDETEITKILIAGIFGGMILLFVFWDISSSGSIAELRREGNLRMGSILLVLFLVFILFMMHKDKFLFFLN